jgi:hypothetical protein
VYNRLKTEIREAFATEEEINLVAVEKLPYLNACLEEGLRVFPPAPIGFLRRIQDGGDVIDGESLPGGVSAGFFFFSRCCECCLMGLVCLELASNVVHGGYVVVPRGYHTGWMALCACSPTPRCVKIKILVAWSLTAAMIFDRLLYLLAHGARTTVPTTSRTPTTLFRSAGSRAPRARRTSRIKSWPAGRFLWDRVVALGKSKLESPRCAQCSALANVVRQSLLCRATPGDGAAGLEL